MRNDMFYGDTYVFSLKDVKWVKYDRLLTNGIVEVAFTGPAGVTLVDTVSGFGGQELIYRLRPSALEGKRFKWRKHMWAIHNIFGHPLMQILAWMRCYKAAMWIHDVTTPQPLQQESRE